MSLSRFTIDGQTCEQAGVNNLSFSWVNKSEDTCTLDLADGGVMRRQWTDGQRVSISFDGRVYFVGWVAARPESMTDAAEGATVTLEGPWYWLKRITFGRQFSAGPIFSTVQLFLPKDGVLQSPKQALAEVLNWAAKWSGNAFQVGTLEDMDLPGSPPPEWVSGAYCSDLVRKVAGWMPAFSLWVDYTTAVPTVHLTRPGSRKSHTFAKGSEPLLSANLQRNSQMAPSAILVRYEGNKTDGNQVAVVKREDAYPLGSLASQPGAVVLTLSEADDIRLPIAQGLYESARLFEWSGSVATLGQMLDLKPGDLVTVTGRENFTGSNLLVQQVSLVAETLQFTLSMGAPAHLGATDLLDLFWFLQGSGNRSTTPEPVLDLHSFKVYTDFDPLSVPFKTVVKIAPGNVNFGEGSKVARWLGKDLNNAEPPSEKMAKGYKREFFLRVVWMPEVGRFSSTDVFGNPVQSYRALTQGEVLRVEVQNGQGTNRAPFVNASSGAASQGEFFFPLASVEEVDGKLRVTQHRDRDLNAFFTPPNYLYLIDA
jgi:hypothetical protein